MFTSSPTLFGYLVTCKLVLNLSVKGFYLGLIHIHHTYIMQIFNKIFKKSARLTINWTVATSPPILQTKFIKDPTDVFLSTTICQLWGGRSTLKKQP